MTASISRNAFFYGATESISEIVFPVALTAARYTVLAYDLATSDEARQTYRWVKDMGIALGQLAFWSVVWAYAKVSVWAEAEVQGCLFVADEDYEIDFQQDYDVPDDIWNSDPDHIPDAGEMVEADPSAPEANPAYAAVVATQSTAPTIRELKRMASEARIKGYGTMPKARLMEALALA
jgi:hypothetical protein